MTGAEDRSEPLVLHATTVALDGRGLLITGPSGSGKSALALELMAYGAGLIADDRTELRQVDGQVIASCPEPLKGLIEARGFGILHATPSRPVPIAAVADLSKIETDRLPPFRVTEILGHAIPVFHNPGTGHFASALLQYLKGGRAE